MRRLSKIEIVIFILFFVNIFNKIVAVVLNKELIELPFVFLYIFITYLFYRDIKRSGDGISEETKQAVDGWMLRRFVNFILVKRHIIYASIVLIIVIITIWIASFTK